MKRTSILCAVTLLAIGTYSPAQAISTSQPGFFNQCMTAYMQDPAAYERDCNNSMSKGLSEPDAKLEPAPAVVLEPCPLGSLPNVLELGARLRVATPHIPDHCLG